MLVNCLDLDGFVLHLFSFVIIYRIKKSIGYFVELPQNPYNLSYEKIWENGGLNLH